METDSKAASKGHATIEQQNGQYDKVVLGGPKQQKENYTAQLSSERKIVEVSRANLSLMGKYPLVRILPKPQFLCQRAESRPPNKTIGGRDSPNQVTSRDRQPTADLPKTTVQSCSGTFLTAILGNLQRPRGENAIKIEQELDGRPSDEQMAVLDRSSAPLSYVSRAAKCAKLDARSTDPSSKEANYRFTDASASDNPLLKILRFDDSSAEQALAKLSVETKNFPVGDLALTRIYLDATRPVCLANNSRTGVVLPAELEFKIPQNNRRPVSLPLSDGCLSKHQGNYKTSDSNAYKGSEPIESSTENDTSSDEKAHGHLKVGAVFQQKLCVETTADRPEILLEKLSNGCDEKPNQTSNIAATIDPLKNKTVIENEVPKELKEKNTYIKSNLIENRSFSEVETFYDNSKSISVNLNTNQKSNRESPNSSYKRSHSHQSKCTEGIIDVSTPNESNESSKKNTLKRLSSEISDNSIDERTNRPTKDVTLLTEANNTNPIVRFNSKEQNQCKEDAYYLEKGKNDETIPLKCSQPKNLENPINQNKITVIKHVIESNDGANLISTDKDEIYYIESYHDGEDSVDCVTIQNIIEEGSTIIKENSEDLSTLKEDQMNSTAIKSHVEENNLINQSKTLASQDNPDQLKNIMNNNERQNKDQETDLYVAKKEENTPKGITELILATGHDENLINKQKHQNHIQTIEEMPIIHVEEGIDLLTIKEAYEDNFQPLEENKTTVDCVTIQTIEEDPMVHKENSEELQILKEGQMNSKASESHVEEKDIINQSKTLASQDKTDQLKNIINIDEGCQNKEQETDLYVAKKEDTAQKAHTKPTFAAEPNENLINNKNDQNHIQTIEEEPIIHVEVVIDQSTIKERDEDNFKPLEENKTTIDCVTIQTIQENPMVHKENSEELQTLKEGQMNSTTIESHVEEKELINQYKILISQDKPDQLKNIINIDEECQNKEQETDLYVAKKEDNIQKTHTEPIFATGLNENHTNNEDDQNKTQTTENAVLNDDTEIRKFPGVEFGVDERFNTEDQIIYPLSKGESPDDFNGHVSLASGAFFEELKNFSKEIKSLQPYIYDMDTIYEHDAPVRDSPGQNQREYIVECSPIKSPDGERRQIKYEIINDSSQDEREDCRPVRRGGTSSLDKCGFEPVQVDVCGTRKTPKKSLASTLKIESIPCPKFNQKVSCSKSTNLSNDTNIKASKSLTFHDQKGSRLTRQCLASAPFLIENRILSPCTDTKPEEEELVDEHLLLNKARVLKRNGTLRRVGLSRKAKPKRLLNRHESKQFCCEREE